MENHFQSTKDVRTQNLKALKEICEHLTEHLDLIIVGPAKKRFDKRFIEAQLNGHAKSSNLRFVKFSFDNKKCELNITFLFVSGSKDKAENHTYNMNDFDEKMLTSIRQTTREWIYDGIIADQKLEG